MIVATLAFFAATTRALFAILARSSRWRAAPAKLGCRDDLGFRFGGDLIASGDGHKDRDDSEEKDRTSHFS